MRHDAASRYTFYIWLLHLTTAFIDTFHPRHPRVLEALAAQLFSLLATRVLTKIVSGPPYSYFQAFEVY